MRGFPTVQVATTQPRFIKCQTNYALSNSDKLLVTEKCQNKGSSDEKSEQDLNFCEKTKKSEQKRSAQKILTL